LPVKRSLGIWKRHTSQPNPNHGLEKLANYLHFKLVVTFDSKVNRFQVVEWTNGLLQNKCQRKYQSNLFDFGFFVVTKCLSFGWTGNDGLIPSIHQEFEREMNVFPKEPQHYEIDCGV
jgi:hypothetical protein